VVDRFLEKGEAGLVAHIRPIIGPNKEVFLLSKFDFHPKKFTQWICRHWFLGTGKLLPHCYEHAASSGRSVSAKNNKG
jgi:hypothetical protein